MKAEKYSHSDCSQQSNHLVHASVDETKIFISQHLKQVGLSETTSSGQCLSGENVILTERCHTTCYNYRKVNGRVIFRNSDVNFQKYNVIQHHLAIFFGCT